MTTETEGVTSGGTGADNKVDVKQWLKDNKLTEVEKIFLEKEISIEELADFSENDLNEFGKDIGLDTLQRKRFVKAIQKLQANKPSNKKSDIQSLQTQNLQNSFNNVIGNFNQQLQSGPIIVSPEEHDAIGKLYRRYEDSMKLITQIGSCNELIEQSTLQCQETINKSFQQINQLLMAKKEELLKLADSMKNEKRFKLLSQLDSLSKYSKKMTEGKEKYESLINDQSLDIHKRKVNILSMLEPILHESNLLIMSTQPKLEFPITQQQTQQFLEGLEIDDCDQPFPPILVIKKISFTFVNIEWKVDERQVEFQKSDVKRILEFSLEHAKLPKEKYRLIKVKKTDDQKEKESLLNDSKKDKKDKKEKKKKKKKDKDESSSEDESDDDEEKSDDSEESSADSDDSDKKHKKKGKKSKKEKNKT